MMSSDMWPGSVKMPPWVGLGVGVKVGVRVRVRVRVGVRVGVRARVRGRVRVGVRVGAAEVAPAHPEGTRLRPLRLQPPAQRRAPQRTAFAPVATPAELPPRVTKLHKPRGTSVDETHLQQRVGMLGE